MRRKNNSTRKQILEKPKYGMNGVLNGSGSKGIILTNNSKNNFFTLKTQMYIVEKRESITIS